LSTWFLATLILHAKVHGAGGAPRQAQVLSAGRGMAARPTYCRHYLPAVLPNHAGSMFDTIFGNNAGSMFDTL